MARNRIVEYIRVPASELLANPRNWRRHPSSQRNALRAVVDEVGFVGALLAYRSGGELVLLDGHLRVLMYPDAVFPVLVSDLSDEEAALVLATFDAVSSMAFPDVGKLNDLLAEIKSSATSFLSNLVDGVDLSFLETAAAAGPGAMAQYANGANVPPPAAGSSPSPDPAPPPPADLFLRPAVDRSTVKSWAVHLPKERFSVIIESARTLAEAMGYADDPAGLVMACIRLVAEQEGVS